MNLFTALMIGSLTASVQAYVPSAPIQWMSRVVTPKISTGPFWDPAAPQQLLIKDPPSRMSRDNVPRFTLNSDNSITLEGTDSCIEATSPKSGAAVRLNRCIGEPAQKWSWIPDNYGGSYIQLKDTDQCLDASIEGGFNGAPIVIWECHSKGTEAWKFEELAPLPKQGRYVVMNLITLAGVAALSLTALLWQYTGPRKLVPFTGGGTSSLDEGGILLSSQAAVQTTATPSKPSQRHGDVKNAAGKSSSNVSACGSEGQSKNAKAPPSNISRDEFAVREEADVAPAQALEAAASAAKPAATDVAVPKGKAKAKAKAKARRRKKSDIDGDDPAQGAAPASQEAGATRTRKAKREGPYTKFKEEGAIPEPQVQRKQIADGAASFKAVAWNINGLRAFFRKRPEALPDLIKQEQPDVIGLMEHKLQEGAEDTESTMKALAETMPEYEAVALHCSTAKKGYSGTVMFVRKGGPQLLSAVSLDLPSAENEGRLIAAEFESLFVILAYVPNSGEGLKRLDERIEKWDVELREKLQEFASKKPTLLLGDLNVAHRDEDIWNVEAPHVPKSAGTTPQERTSFSTLLEAGFVDGFAHLHPETLGAFTYWSVRARNRPKNRGLRLDYAVVSQAMLPLAEPSEDKVAQQQTNKPLLVDVFHLPEMSNGDHCPIGALFAV